MTDNTRRCEKCGQPVGTLWAAMPLAQAGAVLCALDQPHEDESS